MLSTRAGGTAAGEFLCLSQLDGEMGTGSIAKGFILGRRKKGFYLPKVRSPGCSQRHPASHWKLQTDSNPVARQNTEQGKVCVLEQSSCMMEIGFFSCGPVPPYGSMAAGGPCDSSEQGDIQAENTLPKAGVMLGSFLRNK